MADFVTERLAEITELLAQASRAESSLDFRAEIIGAQLRGAAYRGSRELLIGGRTEATMHAVAITDADGKSRDIMLCRTPELAKFIALLLGVGERAIDGYFKALKQIASESSK